MKKILFLLCAFIGIGFGALAQNKYAISGEIKDSKTGEIAIGATIQVKELSGTGVSTNAYGFYSLTLPEGKYTLITRYIGYKADTQKVILNKSIRLSIKLKEESLSLSEVEISTEKKNNNVTENRMGVNKLDIKEISTVPVIFGEKDILKTIQLLPGVLPAGDGNSGFYVRGGGPDQNLILLDEAVVYNPSHLAGFFSVFNSDALKDITLYKGAQPAEYGGRLSSVLDVKMKDGNNQNVNVDGGIGLISSRLTIEGPLVKDKSSFIISGRRTYGGELFSTVYPLFNHDDTIIKKSKLYFYDLNMKVNYTLNDNNRLFLSSYFGRDVLQVGGLLGTTSGNATVTARWNHVFNDRLFSNTSLIYSNYSYDINIGIAANNIDITSYIQDYNIKQDFQYYLNSNNTVKFGIQGIYHLINPGNVNLNGVATSLSTQLRRSVETGYYINNEQNITEKFKLNYGLRLSIFNDLGKQSIYTYDVAGNATDSANYKYGQIIKTYYGIEPRLAMTYIVNDVSSIKASYNRGSQYLHLLSNSTTSTPFDLWVPSTNNVKPGIVDQFSTGYFRNFKDNSFEFSAEVYYKWMQNMIDYKPGADLRFNDKVESQLVYGVGRAYGLELFLKKKYGKFNGWIGYTLGKSEFSFAQVNSGAWYASRYDRRHDISIVGNYEITKDLVFSSVFVFYSGQAATFPNGRYYIDGHLIPYYSERNGNRFPSYNRLDVSLTWYNHNKFSWFGLSKKSYAYESNWNVSIYNVYARANPYEIIFQPNKDNPSQTEAIQVSLFRFVPSISYNFKF